MVNLLVFVHNFDQICNLKVTIFGATTLCNVATNELMTDNITRYFRLLKIKERLLVFLSGPFL
jgi:hypothetical protein